MTYKNKIIELLSLETGDLEKDISKVTNRLKAMMKSGDIRSIEKITEYDSELKELRAAQMKLYEMMGRIDEIEE